jgi:hypothetical protein
MYCILLLLCTSISKRKANWIGYVLRRNCLLQRVIEGKIKGGIGVTGRRWRRCRKLLGDLNFDLLTWRMWWDSNNASRLQMGFNSVFKGLRKGEDTLIWRRKLWIALCGELALEEALDLSWDRLLNEWMHWPYIKIIPSWNWEFFRARKCIQCNECYAIRYYSGTVDRIVKGEFLTSDAGRYAKSK